MSGTTTANPMDVMPSLELCLLLSAAGSTVVIRRARQRRHHIMAWLCLVFPISALAVVVVNHSVRCILQRTPDTALLISAIGYTAAIVPLLILVAARVRSYFEVALRRVGLLREPPPLALPVGHPEESGYAAARERGSQPGQVVAIGLLTLGVLVSSVILVPEFHRANPLHGDDIHWKRSSNLGLLNGTMKALLFENNGRLPDQVKAGMTVRELWPMLNLIGEADELGCERGWWTADTFVLVQVGADRRTWVWSSRLVDKFANDLCYPREIRLDHNGMRQEIWD